MQRDDLELLVGTRSSRVRRAGVFDISSMDSKDSWVQIRMLQRSSSQNHENELEETKPGFGRQGIQTITIIFKRKIKQKFGLMLPY